MQDIAGSYPHSDSRNDNYFSVVSNLMSLVAHIQASMNMLETEITGNCRSAIRRPLRMSSFWMTSHSAT
jgi:hypothetical protein